MRLVRFILLASIILVVGSCQKESFELSSDADDFFFLKHEGADMPVWVEGNTASKVFILMLHGGPGGSAFVFNGLLPNYTDPLEERYGVVYWEQRSAGAAQGSFNENKLTLDQYVEDLERLVFLLKGKYGSDIKIFLSGLSWGGYLGNAYLAKENNQDQIQGWINQVGPHDFRAIGNRGREKLLFYANQQLDFGNYEEEWLEVKTFCENTQDIITRDDFLKVNSYAHRAEQWMRDSLDVTTDVVPINDQLAFVFNSPFNSNAWLSNRGGIFSSELIDELLVTNLSMKIPNIQLPTIIIGGHYDFVVPTEVLHEQFELLGSSDKEIHILPKSGHGVASYELDKLLDLINTFIEEHR